MNEIFQKQTLIARMLVLLMLFIFIFSSGTEAHANEIDTAVKVEFSEAIVEEVDLSSPDLNFTISQGFKEIQIYVDEINPLCNQYISEDYERKFFYETILILIEEENIKQVKDVQEIVLKEVLYKIAADEGISLDKNGLNNLYKKIINNDKNISKEVQKIKESLVTKGTASKFGFIFYKESAPVVGSREEKNDSENEDYPPPETEGDVVKIDIGNQSSSDGDQVIRSGSSSNNSDNNHDYDSGDYYQDLPNETEEKEEYYDSEKEEYYVFLENDSGKNTFLKTKIKNKEVSFEKEKEILSALYEEYSKDEKICLLIDKNKAMVSKDGKLFITKAKEKTNKSIDEIKTEYQKIQTPLLFELG
jgi:hypothetical protein